MKDFWHSSYLLSCLGSRLQAIAPIMLLSGGLGIAIGILMQSLLTQPNQNLGTKALLPGMFWILTILGLILVIGLLISQNITQKKRLKQGFKKALEREYLLAEIALKIRQSLELNQILQTTVTEVRHLLQTDRVYIGFVKNEDDFQIVAESLNANYPSLLEEGSPQIPRHQNLTQYLPQTTLIADNIADLHPDSQLKEYYQSYQVKSVLAIPLITQEQTIGLLVCHQCSQTRQWQKGEVRLLEQLGTQVAIAVQQAQLFQRVQVLNHHLEAEVKQRTLELEERMLELEDLEQMKAIFVQAVSHDLRTSMMGLLMLLKNLQTRSGESINLSRPILERLIQSGDRSLTLLNALSEDHFAESHPLTIHPQPLNLADFLEDFLQDWRSLFEQNQVNFNYHLTPAFSMIKADITYLRQVFNNLFSNVLKHNPPGIELVLEAVVERQMLRFTLKDNGIGMNQAQCNQLFGLYLRSNYNHRLTGIGLGCYQCRQIVEAHGGKIGVVSQPGQGTQFWFTLPQGKRKKKGIKNANERTH